MYRDGNVDACLYRDLTTKMTLCKHCQKVLKDSVKFTKFIGKTLCWSLNAGGYLHVLQGVIRTGLTVFRFDDLSGYHWYQWQKTLEEDC